jgi:hypothetical protein
MLTLLLSGEYRTTELSNKLQRHLLSDSLAELNSESSQSHIVTDGRSVSQSVSLGVEPHLRLMTRYLLYYCYGLVFVGRPTTPKLTQHSYPRILSHTWNNIPPLGVDLVHLHIVQSMSWKEPVMPHEIMKNCLFMWQAANLRHNSSRLYSTETARGETAFGNVTIVGINSCWTTAVQDQRTYKKKHTYCFCTCLKHVSKLHINNTVTVSYIQIIFWHEKKDTI